MYIGSKLVAGDGSSEGIRQLAEKSGTDEQERHMRLFMVGQASTSL